MSGFMIAAPSSGAGKTTITLGLLRLLRRRGIRLSAGKAGPDYIDPQFHALALGQECYNFDPWGMRHDMLLQQAQNQTQADELLIIEAMMGLFDGAADGAGSAADLAKLLRLPVILLVDCSKMSHSIAAIVHGFHIFQNDISISGVILNKVGSQRHEVMLRNAVEKVGIPALGAVHRDDALSLPERHLGLVQANEQTNVDAFIDTVADRLELCIDVEMLLEMSASHIVDDKVDKPSVIQPLGQRIAVAKDVAFSFIYPHILQGWREMGAEISFFSPLGDEGPTSDSDAVFLPGGYPELHCAAITSAENFRTTMNKLAEKSAKIYGECGGYMVLGEGLTDAQNVSHQMLGLLPIETSFAKRKRNLGYRTLIATDEFFGCSEFRAHEFHYSTEIQNNSHTALFTASDALDNDLGSIGARQGNTAGSYMHIIDRAY